MLQQPPSKSTFRHSLPVLILVLAVGMLTTSGCKTFESPFAKPKLPSLAFWKKGTDSVPPPPPSRHLDPSLTSGAESMLSQTTNDLDQRRSEIDSIKNGIAAAQRNLDIGSGNPIRKPYGNEEVSLGSGSKSSGSGTKPFSSDFKTAMNSTGNSIDAKLEAAKSKSGSFVNNSLSDAQQKFNSAVADVKKPAGRGDFRSPADIMSTKPSNDFKQALAKTQSNLQNSIATANKNNGFKNPLAKVNQSLYDMNGQLTTATTKTPEAAVNSVANSVDAARQRFNNALGSGSKSVAPVEVASKPQPFGGQIKDKIASAASGLKTPTLGGGDNSFKSAASTVKTGTQNLLGNAKDRVSTLGAGLGFPKANARPQKFTTAVPSSGGDFNRTRVANVTPVNTQNQNSTFAQRNGLDSNLTKSWNNGLNKSQLAPFQVGSSTPGNGLRTASLQTDSSGFASAPASTIPAAFDQHRNAMTSHVNEIDIPTKILSGTGSYAPGSVNKVR